MVWVGVKAPTYVGGKVMKKIKALVTFAGPDAGRGGKLVSMSPDDVQEVSDEFAKDVMGAGFAELVKKPKVKAISGAGN